VCLLIGKFSITRVECSMQAKLNGMQRSSSMHNLSVWSRLTTQTTDSTQKKAMEAVWGRDRGRGKGR